MNSPESPKFTEYENEMIGQYAVEFAELGEEFMDVLQTRKYEIIKLRFILLEKDPDKTEAVYLSKLLKHDQDFIAEVERRAIAIMQLQGTDDTSVLLQLKEKYDSNRLGDASPNE